MSQNHFANNPAMQHPLRDRHGANRTAEKLNHKKQAGNFIFLVHHRLGRNRQE
jgi:hypothetical protein